MYLPHLKMPCLALNICLLTVSDQLKALIISFLVNSVIGAKEICLAVSYVYIYTMIKGLSNNNRIGIFDQFSR